MTARATALRFVRRADAAVARRLAQRFLPAFATRPLRVGCVFVRWEPVRADQAFHKLRSRLQSLSHDVAFCVVDNRDQEAPSRREGDVLYIAGDNRRREFSAWDRGIAALREQSDGGIEVWVLANDRYEAVESPLVGHITDASISAVWQGHGLAGRVDAYPRRVSINDAVLDRWVCTALMVVADDVLRAVEPLAHATDEVIDHAVDAVRAKSGTATATPMDPQHVAYLREWLTGQGGALPTHWYRSADPAAAGDQEARSKLASILDEQGLSVRVRRAGHALASLADVDSLARLGVVPSGSVEQGVRTRWRSLLAPEVIAAAARRRARVERLADFHIRPAFCPICGRVTTMVFRGGSARESWVCRSCRSFNRQRQIAAVLCRRDLAGRSHRSLRDYAEHSGEAVYLAEQGGPLHEALRHASTFAASEYMDPRAASGEVINGVLHQDLQRLSFAGESFDLVVTTDVFEHVPAPYTAHAEILRVLRPGGRHVFTVPYDEGREDDDVRAVLDAEGNIEYLTEPQYHLDPLRPEGALVFTIFGTGMSDRLRDLGYEATVHRPHRPSQGIFGPGNVVFEARKPR